MRSARQCIDIAHRTDFFYFAALDFVLHQRAMPTALEDEAFAVRSNG